MGWRLMCGLGVVEYPDVAGATEGRGQHGGCRGQAV